MRLETSSIRTLLAAVHLWAAVPVSAGRGYSVSPVAEPSLTLSVVSDGSLPELVEARNPSTPVVLEADAYRGGLDAGEPGDAKAFYLASARDKRWKGGLVNPEALGFRFRLAAHARRVEVAVGYFAGRYQTRQFEVSLDDHRIISVRLPKGQYGNPTEERRLKTVTVSVTLPPTETPSNVHALFVRQTDWWGVTEIDAVRVYGRGVRWVHPTTGRPVTPAQIRRMHQARQPHLPESFSLPRGCRAFDFGTGSSPVWTEGGFVRVTDRTRYSEGRGYGWGGKGAARLESAEDGAGRDALRRDYVGAWSGSPNTPLTPPPEFQVRLAPGRYRVFVIAGGRPWPPRTPAMTIESGGRTVWRAFMIHGRNDTVLHRPAIIHSTFETGTAGPVLSLRFPKPLLVLDALVIYPVALKQEVEPHLRRLVEDYYLPVCIQVKRGRVSAAYRAAMKGKLESLTDEDPGPARPAKFVPSETDRQRGFVFFVHDPCRAVFPDSVPLEAERDRNRLTAFAAPGEFEPVTFSVRTMRSLKNAHVEVGDLVSPGGRIAARNITVQRVAYVRRSVTTRPNGQWKWAPKILVPAEPEDLRADFTRTYWLTLRVPPDAVAGVYRGQVAFLPAQAPGVRLPLTVEVLPFPLDPSRRWVGMYWSQQAWYAYPDESVEKQFRDMARHGVNATTAYGLEGAEVKIVDGRLQIDFAPLARLMALRKKYGLVGPVPMTTIQGTIEALGFEKRTPAFEKYYTEYVRLVVAEARRSDWPEPLFYPVDEPSNETLMQQGKYLTRLIKSVPGAQTYITIQPYELKVFGPWLDARCYSRFGPADAAETCRLKRRLFYYTGAYVDPLSNRLACGFALWASGAEGMYFWTYCWTKGNPLFDLDNDERETGVVICSPTGDILPTTWWEGVREGVDDLRYLQTLEHQLRVQTNEDWKKRAQGFLAELRGKIGVGTEARTRLIRRLRQRPATLTEWRQTIVRLLREARETPSLGKTRGNENPR